MGAGGALGAIGAACDLEAWSSISWSDGLQLPDLRALETLEVTTKNTVYEITLMDPRNGEVLVRGGTFFPVYTRVRLAGASLAGSFLKLLGIYVGFSIEFHTDDGPIVTTRVRAIAVTVNPRSLIAN
jgi:hypothetical protein